MRNEGKMMAAEQSFHEVTAIEKQANRPWYNIYLDGQYRFSVHEDVLVKHRLMKGNQINDQQLACIMYDEELHQVMHAALRYVGRKSRSVQEVKNKLQSMSFDMSLVDVVIQQLEQQGIVDDQQYALKLAEYRFFTQKKGRKWIEQELKHKGISNSFIQQALESIGHKEEYEQAFLLAVKKWSKTSGDYVSRKRKTLSYLMRRGYPQSIALRAVEAVSTNEENRNEEDPFV